MSRQTRRHDWASIRLLSGDVIEWHRSTATVVSVKTDAQTEIPCKNGNSLQIVAPRIQAVKINIDFSIIYSNE